MSRSLIPAGLLLIAVSYGFARFAYGLFLPEIREDLALTTTLSGIIGSGSYLGYCLAIVASAFAVARFGPRRVAVAAGIVAATGMLAIAMSPSPPVLAFAVLFAGMSTGLASPPMADAVATVIAQDRQSLANTVINSGTSAGIALSGPIALVATGHWRQAYLLFALIAAVATIWVAFAAPTATAVGATVDGHTTHRMRLGQLARIEALPVMLAATGMGFASAACWLFGREIMVAIGGLSATITTIAWVVIGIAGFAGAFAGSLVERFGIVVVHRLALLLLALGTAAIGTLPGNATLILLAAALFGSAYIMLTGVYLVWGVKVYADAPAVGLGLPFLMISVGQVLGGPTVGLLVELAGYRLAFFVAGAIALLTILVRPAAGTIWESGPSKIGIGK